MSRVKWMVVLVVFAALVAGAPTAVETGAAVVNGAPVWPIPAGVPAGPPPIPALPAAGNTAPPADQIADPVRPAAVCGGWYLQSNYAGRWQAGSSWWEYQCNSSDYQYHNTCPGPACDLFCPYCWSETQEWTDYFYWDGSNAVFYGQLYSDSVLYDYQGYDGEPPYVTTSWWDGPTAQWYLLNAYPLTVSKQGSGSGTVTSSPAGISCGNTCFEIVDAGNSVALTATPDVSSVFAGWSGDCWGTGVCQVTMDQARSVIAIFRPKQFTLSVATAGTGGGLVYISPGATGCRACGQSFDIGTSVTLTPVPDASAVFTGWSGDCSGTGACQVTMDQDRSVTANFAQTGFTLTVAKAGTGSGQVSSTPSGIACGSSCQASFEAGRAVTLTATPDASSIFAGWSGDCSGTGSCQVTMDQARFVTATFVPNAPPYASFTVTCTGLRCSFDGGGSADRDGTIAGYSWDFGDGSGGSGKTAAHAYARSGSYTVTLTVTDNEAATATAAHVVAVTNAAPTAAFIISCSGLTCSFDGGASSDNDGTIRSYRWDFGDGTSGAGELVQHTYGQPRSYSVGLIVTDNDGATGTVSKTFNPISLSARGYKQKGLAKVDLAWSGSSGASFDVYRNGGKIATVQASAYTDSLNTKGSGSYVYEVCALATSICSNQTTVIF
jgi:PKD repeat protein